MSTLSKLALTLVCTATFACGEVVPSDRPIPGTTPEPVVPPGSSSAPPAPGPSGSAPTPIRVVEQRNPYGNLNPGNLMLDGDFEFSGRQGQMPWIKLSGEGVLNYETGGLCFSGVRCARLEADQAIFGWMAVPKGTGRVDIRVRARALGTAESCPGDHLVVYVIDIDSGRAEAVIPLSDTESVRGYCSYEATVAPELAFRSPGLYIEAGPGTQGAIVVDDIVVTEAPQMNGAKPFALRKPSPESQARISAAASAVRKRFPRSNGLSQSPGAAK